MADQESQQKPIKDDLWRAFMAQYQKRQQWKRRHSQAPEQRYFRTNSGTTDYVQLTQPVVLSGDFEISILLCPTVSSMHILADGEGVSRFWFNSTSLEIAATSGYVRFPNTLITGQLNLIVLRRESNVTSIYVNGDELTPSTSVYLTNAVKFNTIGGQILSSSLSMLIGIASNLSVVDAGALANSWAINDNSDTIIDSVGGNNGTVINGTASDWELYTKVGNTWVGNTSGEVIPIAY